MDLRMDILLDCPPAIARIRPERIVEEANWAVRLPESWDREPSVHHPATLPDGFDLSCQHRFAAPDGDEWFAVEYMKLHPGHPTADNIAQWVGLPNATAGKPFLMEPEGLETEVSWLDRLPMRDPEFLARHKADRMCLFMGQIKAGGASRFVGVLCLDRGRERWRIVLVVRDDYSSVGVGEFKNEEKCSKTLGRVFGTFRILSGARIDPQPS
jgi:hypothetical protein